MGASGQQPRSGDTNPPIEPPDSAQAAVSDVEKAKADAEAAVAAAEAAKTAPDGRFVQYLVPLLAAQQVVSRPSGAPSDGSPASRIGANSAETHITPEQWNSQGIPATTTLEWNMSNNWRVPVEQLTELQLNFLLVGDRKHNGVRFELVDGNGNKVDR
jgi:hypothetical protein